MKSRYFFILLTMLLFLFAAVSCKKSSTTETQQSTKQPQDSIPNLPGWTLVWNDEFNGNTIDLTKWNYEVNGDGGGNNELQYYTDSSWNSFIEDSCLVIQALRQNHLGKQYTSARLNTNLKGDWLYGRFEIRAKLPNGVGTWPAIWMLSTDWSYGGWPASGEIDIMEHVGYDLNVIHGSTHSQKYYFKIGTQKTATIRLPDVTTQFHTYAIEWYADRIDFYVDTTKYFSSLNEGTGWQAWPFDKRFHLILNLAIGGDWGGVKGVDNSAFPQRMYIDYVRVYKKNN